ncbi:MAG: beta-amylase [Monoraphidium minutum]|nr:MAG: beta-amylase [Monoraphidium minutum]
MCLSVEEESELHRLLRESRQRLTIPEADEERWPAPYPAGAEPHEAPSTSGRDVGCPVFVMLPLDTVWVVDRDARRVAILKREKALEIALHTLRAAGVEGVMVDVWWGICERGGPRIYDFSAYRRLFHKCAAAGLRVQAVMSFHAAGGNVGDTCKIPLPKWVVDIGERNPDIFYTDKQMHRNKECLSLGCDEVPLFWGRTPVDMYRDFVDAFADAFDYLFGTVITEVTVGMGPAGELRYPSYPEGDGRWRFPGVGEYQCYDKYMLADLRRAAHQAGHPEWGHGGPHDAGHYNSKSWETGFFVSQGGNWQTEYGGFYLSWYSGLLVKHADRILGAAAAALNKPGRPRLLRSAVELDDGHVVYEFEPAVKLGAKLAGVHWWFKSRAHAAELTAGYYNTRDCDGYTPVMRTLAKYGARLSFTCVEMRDCEHPPEGRCSPQGLLQQVLECAEAHGVPLAGENALQRYDEHAFERIAESAFGKTAAAGRLEQLTFLRMGDLMFDNWDAFTAFLTRMRGAAET